MPLAAVAGAAIFLTTGENAPLSNAATPAPVYPTLYSDSRITERAKESDPVLAASVSLPTQSMTASVLDAILGVKDDAPPPVVRKDNLPERGTWLWTPTMQITPAYRDEILRGAKARGVRTIYLSLDSYLDIFTLPEGPAKETAKRAFDERVADFIRHADRAGITVDAEGGWRNWAEEGHEYKAFAILNYAIDFNATHEKGFRGVQYDIEPYLLDEFKTERSAVLRRFLSLIEASVEHMRASDLQLSVVIPEFYDGGYDQTSRFLYDFRYTYAIGHLLRTLEKRPESKVIVMAYRNYAEGTDGALHISEGELEAARGFSTKIIVAQEVGDVPPPYITFHATSRKRLENQVSTIETTLANDPAFGGIAYHYVNALLELR